MRAGNVGRWANVRYAGQVLRVFVVSVTESGRVDAMRVVTLGPLQGERLRIERVEFLEYV